MSTEKVAVAYFAIGAAFGLYALVAVVVCGKDAVVAEWEDQYGDRPAQPHALMVAVALINGLFWPLVFWTAMTRKEDG